MRTTDEINAELEAIKTRDIEKIDKSLEDCNKTLMVKLLTGEPYEAWLAKQFQGHLQVIFEFSKLNPIPEQATRNALEGNDHIATIIAKLGWDYADDFKAVTQDMLTHFEEVVKLKRELEQINAAMTPSASVGAQTSATLH